MPPKPRKSPQQKKSESYAKDRRNTYGENAKASRKNLPRKKRRQVREERRLANMAVVADGRVDLELVDIADAKLLKKRKNAWKLKSPDTPLGEVIERKVRQRVRTGALAPETAAETLKRVRRTARRQA
jgi:hypothetical protein